MKITWLGHACFLIEGAGSSLVIDPYDDDFAAELGLAPLRGLSADAVLCSHQHGDHGNAAAVALTGRPCRLNVEAYQTFHDDMRGALLGGNTVFVVSDGETRLCHLGDLGHEPDEALTDALRGLDALLINTGGYLHSEARFAAALADKLAPRVVIPMHYASDDFGIESMGRVEEFTALRRDVKRCAGDSIEVTPQTPAQTAVLTLNQGGRK